MEDVIIRYEANDIIIWSKKKKAYFCSKVAEDNIEIDKVLKGNITAGKIYDELKEIGAISNNKKIIKSDSKKRLMAPLEYYFDFTNVCNLR